MKFLWHNFLTQQIDTHFYSDMTHLAELYPFGDVYCNCLVLDNNNLYVTMEALSGVYKTFKCPDTLLVNQFNLLKLWNDTQENLLFASFQINSDQILSFLIVNYDTCYFFLDNTDSSKMISFVKSKTPLHLSSTTDNWIILGWDTTQTVKLQSVFLGDDSTIASLETTLVSVVEPWEVFRTYHLMDRMQWTFFLDSSDVVFYSWDLDAYKSLIENSENSFSLEPTEANLQTILQSTISGHDQVVFTNNSTVVTKSGNTYRMLHIPSVLHTGDMTTQEVFNVIKYNLFKELVVKTEGNDAFYQWSIGKILLEKHGTFSGETNMASMVSVVAEQSNPWLKPLQTANDTIMKSIVYDRFNDESDLL